MITTDAKLNLIPDSNQREGGMYMLRVKEGIRGDNATAACIY